MRFDEFAQSIPNSFAIQVFKAMQSAEEEEDRRRATSLQNLAGSSQNLAGIAPEEPESNKSSEPTSVGNVPSEVTPAANTKAKISGNYPAFREPGFKAALEKTASNLGIDPNHLIAIMKQESGLNPKAVNKSSHATGLIQFMPRTAKGLGTSVQALYNMSATEQMPWVEKYFRANHIKPGMGLGDLYMAVFYPAAVGKSNNHVIGKSGGAVYNQNRGLDRNKDGVITVSDVKQSVARFA